MHIFEIESIDYELEFMPKLFRTRENKDSQRALVRHNRQHKKHYRSHHPSTYLTPWANLFYTNSSSIHLDTPCLNAGHPCSYVPMLMLTQCGVLVCLFVAVYSLCIASKPKARKDAKICATAV